MKKLLILFSACAITTSSTLSIVACGEEPVTEIKDDKDKDIDKELLENLKRDISSVFQNHFIQYKNAFVNDFTNDYKFFSKNNLKSLFEGKEDKELNLSISSLNNVDQLKNDLQNFVNLNNLENNLNLLKTNTINNYSIFLSKVQNVYANYYLGKEITIKKQNVEDKIVYTGEFEVNFNWQYFLQSINTEVYTYKVTFNLFENKEYIKEVINITDVGKKLFNQKELTIHFSDTKLGVNPYSSWKDVSQDIANYFDPKKNEQNINDFMKEIEENSIESNGNDKAEIIFEGTNFLDNLVIEKEFQTDSNNLNYAQANVINNILFRANLEDNW
ncbi:hypothetical protein [Spiroplasma floricola]|uniref:Lipoprotein n=1 Tax=Spiroplasma floricola 23-6 TaxID=1336749 RepID=A0A2K8SEA6_9MOLU|nr:hypothetical protein [Spiroplasma floricola]AUB31779.1 hypothetical protein SFLOR_v1c07310 [Spiroplasma floricola 23-6]